MGKGDGVLHLAGGRVWPQELGAALPDEPTVPTRREAKCQSQEGDAGTRGDGIVECGVEVSGMGQECQGWDGSIRREMEESG